MSTKQISVKLRRFFAVCRKKWRHFNRAARAKAAYSRYYRALPVRRDVILLESAHGADLRGNLFYLLRELLSDPAYAGYTVYAAVAPAAIAAAKELLAANGLTGARLTLIGSREYYRLVASAGYLINDTSFLPFFIKKEGQIYLNTWHGTPLKTLGKRVAGEAHAIGNVQRNLLAADFLLFPNDFTMERMVEDYMLADVCRAKALMGGYPRNAAFFDTVRAGEIRRAHGLQGKKVYAWLPTWRGRVGRPDPIASARLEAYLRVTDDQLGEDEILFVNLHPLARRDISLRGTRHIRLFPPQVETYEFLNACDALITDYSSVLFDYPLTRRKIVLFPYDEAEYLAGRGTYFPLSDLPFPRVHTADELVRTLRAPKSYDETDFLRRFCPHDSPDAARRLCARVILGRRGETPERAVPRNGRRNVLLYAGNLAKNGITTSLMNLLGTLDRTRYNYYITFDAGKVSAGGAALADLPAGVRYLACAGEPDMSLRQKTVWALYAKRLAPFWLFRRMTKSVYPTEWRRRYGDIPFSTVIQFNGYEHGIILLFAAASANRVIYVHSDMLREIRTRHIQRRAVLRYAYSHYDKVAAVTRDVIPCALRLGGREGRVWLAPNLLNAAGVRRMARRPLLPDADTVTVPGWDALCAALGSGGKTFITVGRFSPEKGHLRLIDAFDRVWAQRPDTYLIILGGHGPLYRQTVARAAALPCREHIVVVRSLRNPYPLLAGCDYFVLPSFYEGFGLVIAEAAILGKPVVSVDIPGPREFVARCGGRLVDNSADGLYRGMLAQLRGEVRPTEVDYDGYNQSAAEMFRRLLEE